MSTERTPLDRYGDWFHESFPMSHLVISSRARYARNIAGFPFSPHSGPDVLERVAEFIAKSFRKNSVLNDFDRIHLAELDAADRLALREARLTTKEMERDGQHLEVYIAPDAMSSVLINEEDHLRIQVLNPGLDLEGAVSRLDDLDVAVAEVLTYATSDRYGFLTACPTNVGSGLRVSVMLHLPGLALLREVEKALAGIAHYGLTVRGFHGENSEFSGDFYQVSNEVTLGRSVAQTLEIVGKLVKRLVDAEEEARLVLFRRHATGTRDQLWRGFGVLKFAERMDSAEAMRLLSRLRLGIDNGMFENLTHEGLNRLLLEIQPARMERRRRREESQLTRDEYRARFLREEMKKISAVGRT